MPPGAVENVGSAFAESLGDPIVEPGTLAQGRSQLHCERAQRIFAWSKSPGGSFSNKRSAATLNCPFFIRLNRRN
jgi:hypothetical protein